MTDSEPRGCIHSDAADSFKPPLATVAVDISAGAVEDAPVIAGVFQRLVQQLHKLCEMEGVKSMNVYRLRLEVPVEKVDD